MLLLLSLNTKIISALRKILLCRINLPCSPNQISLPHKEVTILFAFSCKLWCSESFECWNYKQYSFTYRWAKSVNENTQSKGQRQPCQNDQGATNVPGHRQKDVQVFCPEWSWHYSKLLQYLPILRAACSQYLVGPKFWSLWPPKQGKSYIFSLQSQ